MIGEKKLHSRTQAGDADRVRNRKMKLSAYAGHTSSSMPMLQHKKYGKLQHYPDANKTANSGQMLHNSGATRGRQEAVPTSAAQEALTTNYYT